ncbi:MAG: hypothetical protein OCU22_04880 [Canidatus Methanoxibalbensis ujae]|nr:hypothetical protein [Candidatus Methanoxibalbensis ujae]
MEKTKKKGGNKIKYNKIKNNRKENKIIKKKKEKITDTRMHLSQIH